MQSNSLTPSSDLSTHTYTDFWSDFKNYVFKNKKQTTLAIHSLWPRSPSFEEDHPYSTCITPRFTSKLTLKLKIAGHWESCRGWQGAEGPLELSWRRCCCSPGPPGSRRRWASPSWASWWSSALCPSPSYTSRSPAECSAARLKLLRTLAPKTTTFCHKIAFLAGGAKLCSNLRVLKDDMKKEYYSQHVSCHLC